MRELDFTPALQAVLRVFHYGALRSKLRESLPAVGQYPAKDQPS